MLARYWLFTLLILSISPLQAEPRWDYLLHCAGCHLENGSGTPPDVPDLRPVIGDFAATPDGRAYLGRVPGTLQAPLEDRALAELLNWMVQRFSAGETDYLPYTEEDIVSFRRQPLYDPLSERKRLLDIMANERE